MRNRIFSWTILLVFLAAMSPLLVLHSPPEVSATGGPLAAFTYNPCVMCAVVGDLVFFNGNWSISQQGDIVSYAWDFGDGTQLKTTSSSTSHDYALPGSGMWQVTLTVQDSTGQTDTISQSVVFNVHPEFTFQPRKPSAGQPVTFNASSSQIYNPSSILLFEWTFGDGGSGSGKQVVHSYTAAGLYRISLTLETSQGNAQTSKTIAVTPPTTGQNMILRSTFGIAYYNNSGQLTVQPASLFVNMTVKGSNSTGTIFNINSGQIIIGPSPTLAVERNFTATSGQAFQSSNGRLTVTAQMIEVYPCQQQQPPCMVPNVIYQLYLTGPSRTVSTSSNFAFFTRLFGFLYNSQTKIGLFFVAGIAPGDLDEDRRVNVSDLVVVAHNIGQDTLRSSMKEASVSPSGYSSEYYADVNGDGVVNIVDFVLVASSFGASY